MLVNVAKVVRGVAFLWGDTFALTRREEKVSDGWYIVVRTPKTFKDKKGTERSYVKVVADVDDAILQDVINIYYATDTGIKLMMVDKFLLIPKQLRDDARFGALSDLIEMGVGFSMSGISKEDETLSFVKKIAGIVASRILEDELERGGIDVKALKDAFFRKDTAKPAVSPDIDVSDAIEADSVVTTGNGDIYANLADDADVGNDDGKDADEADETADGTDGAEVK